MFEEALLTAGRRHRIRTYGDQRHRFRGHGDLDSCNVRHNSVDVHLLRAVTRFVAKLGVLQHSRLLQCYHLTHVGWWRSRVSDGVGRVSAHIRNVRAHVCSLWCALVSRASVFNFE